MKAPWTLQDRWLILQKCIDDGITYTLFGQHGISDNDEVDTTMQVILETGLFALEYYSTWYTEPDNQCTLSMLKVFMKEKFKL